MEKFCTGTKKSGIPTFRLNFTLSHQRPPRRFARQETRRHQVESAPKSIWFWSGHSRFCFDINNLDLDRGRAHRIIQKTSLPRYPAAGSVKQVRSMCGRTSSSQTCPVETSCRTFSHGDPCCKRFIMNVTLYEEFKLWLNYNRLGKPSKWH